MQLRIVKWRYENIRGGIRNLTIDLSNQPRWTLIQMPNGTGKTTTMTLLRAVLTGAELTPEQILELRPDDEATNGLFEIDLLIDDRPFRVELELDFVARRHLYRTTRTQLRAGGSEDGWALPLSLRQLLTPEFTKLFVFDGEFAKEIRAVGADRTTKSIRTLYQLDRLDLLRKEIANQVRLEQERASEFTTAKEQRGLTRLENALSEAEETLGRIKADLKSKQAERARLEKRLEEITVRMADRTAQDAKFASRSATLESDLKDVAVEIANFTTSTLSALRTPPKVSPVLLERLEGLGARLTSLQLPKTISKEFFEELAEANDCVCDRKIGPKEKVAIKAGASKYLAEDQILIINRVKGSIREAGATGSEFVNEADELRVRLRHKRSVEQQLDQLRQEQIDAGDDELRRLLFEQKENEVRIRQLDDEIECLNTRDTLRHLVLQLDWCDNIPLCTKEVNDRRRKFATATQTFEFMQAADLVDALVERVASRALDRLRERVRVATNEKLEHLARSEPLRVEKIGTALELASDRLSAKGGVSEGQSLAVAYAFLASLLSEAPYRLPFVVDSPAVSLDDEVRREVGDVIPELFEQMIMFVISSEKSGFAEAFYARSDVRYITIWRDDSSGTRMCEGLEEFRRFHSVETEEAA